MITKRLNPSSAEPPRDHGLELLLAYDGRVMYLTGGYSLKFAIRLEEPTAGRPHGLRYSFTLHDSRNRRILGFDNAHSVKPLGRNSRRAAAHDHWHRDASDNGRPYPFTDAATLVSDFFNQVERTLHARGVVLEVTGERSNEEI